MIALLLAAQLSAATAPNRIEPPTLCKKPNVTEASVLRPEDRANANVRRLGELPKANFEKAVNRSVSGCTVPAVVKYEVEGDGRAGE